jgi:hypothetical protein
MEARSTSRRGHSAEVRIDLAVNGHVFPVAELGPGFVVLRNPIDHAPAEAEITMSIDGSRMRWRVDLIDGIQTGREDTRIRPCPPPVSGPTPG